MNLISIFQDFVDLIFPRTCQACDQSLIGNEKIICTSCRINLPRANDESIYAGKMDLKFVHLPEVISTKAFLTFSKKGKVQKLLHGIKYKGRKETALLLGQMFGEELKKDGEMFTSALIVPVPLHAKKLKSRGYNQSDMIAEGISKVTGIPWSGTILKRIKNTETQTGKGRNERRENVKGVFALNEAISTKCIIIVDDVLTTGATLEECLEVLKAAGCTTFHVRAIAVANH